MIPSSSIDEFRAVLASAKNVIILSGAGLSAPSGLVTYRGSGNPLWSNPAVVKYAQHTTFKDDPSGSWQFYHQRRLNALSAKPNRAHLALAALNLPTVASRVIPSASKPPLHVTQNLDELSLWALKLLPEPTATESQKRLVQLHGSLFRTHCLSCNHERHSYEPVLAASLDGSGPDTVVDIPVDKLPRCGGDQWSGSNRYGRCGGLLRPDVVWFGEVPPLMGEVAREVTWCDLLIVIGTSALVQPAAGFASQVREHGSKIAIFNIDKSSNDDKADFLFLGSCDVVLPEVLGVDDDVKGLVL
ncbi:sirtuin [Gymnopilus junonius]|uniref:Sirtuin n=1 Tax=Gymnopilus junonius TaxID=109634 RepID=A0A9P5TKQ3_GYMJU|nr:sirtuin [Gymnopilus junonius]